MERTARRENAARGEDVLRRDVERASFMVWLATHNHALIIPSMHFNVARRSYIHRRRPHPQITLHKDRMGGDLFLFTHLLNK